MLSDLLTVVLRDLKQFIPNHVVERLKTQSETIQMASNYQEILQWLLNVGLLPEGNDDEDKDYRCDDEFLIVPYPFKQINSYYNEHRLSLQNEGEYQTNLVFIDEFIRRECSEEKLRENWCGIYPPKSLQAMLRTLLISEISVENKHVILLYVFMDITKVLSEESYSSIVRNLIKFPAVFKMNAVLIKRTQAFWNLDNGFLETAVEELISPLLHDKPLPLWQQEFLIAALLQQGANSLALRALLCPGNYTISPFMEMMTLLANNLMSEALNVQRASGQRILLEQFFEKILQSPNYEKLLELTLTEREGVVLSDYLDTLKKTGFPNHLNIHFVFLLQRSKFLDAAMLVESMSESNGTNHGMNLELPKQVLRAHFASMESTTRKLTLVAYKNDSQLKESPLPLSVNLIQAKCNASNDIYHQCIQSISDINFGNVNDSQKLAFIGSPKLGIFEYKQTTFQNPNDSFSEETRNEHGKRKQIRNVDSKRDSIDGPKGKKRRLDLSSGETKANYSFAPRVNDKLLRNTLLRVKKFTAFPTTPVVQKNTPSNRATAYSPTPPHSILPLVFNESICSDTSDAEKNANDNDIIVTPSSQPLFSALENVDLPPERQDLISSSSSENDLRISPLAVMTFSEEIVLQDGISSPPSEPAGQREIQIDLIQHEVDYEEKSFMSETGGELDDAILISPLMEQAGEMKVGIRSNVKADYFEGAATGDRAHFIDSMETARDGMNNTADSEASVKEEIVQPEIEKKEEKPAEPLPVRPRTLRTRSGSSEKTTRSTRAQSVPHSEAMEPTRTRSQRAATEDRDSKKDALRIKTLERIEEQSSPLPSPGMLTRQRSRLLKAADQQNLIQK